MDGKSEKFNLAVDSIYSNDAYMSNMDNWCAVHVTKYMPRVNSDGVMYIPSTGMATDFEFPRATVHVTLNHIVTSHGYGSWDDTPIVILTPYNDVAKKNGNPVEIAGTDTYWSVNPDRGLVLSENAYIVQPDDNGPLYKIGEHGATYKRDNYTDEEVEQIESALQKEYSDKFEEYTRYKNGDLKEWEIKKEFVYDKRIKKMYDSAKDKKAFLRGLFEESRFAILSKFLRDIVTNKAMEKMGFKYVDSIRDANETSMVIASVADAKNIPSNVSNKGHSNSLYAAIEDEYNQMYWVLHDNEWFDIPGLLSITENKPIDFDKIYQDVYESIIKSWMESCKRSLQSEREQMKKYIDGSYPHLSKEQKDTEIKKLENKISEWEKFIKNLLGKDTIAQYDKNLAETLRRHCARLTKDYDAWRDKIAKKPDFDILVQKLRNLVGMQNMQNSGRVF